MTEERIEGRYIHTTSLAYRERGERPAGLNEFDCPDLKVIFNENHPQYKEQYYNLWRKKYYATTPSGEPLPPRLTHP